MLKNNYSQPAMILIKENLIKYLIFLLCLGICLFQIWKICEMYFSYKTIITFGFEDQSVISLPAITFCIKKNLMLREEYLRNVSDETFADKSEERIKKYSQSLLFLNNKTIDEQISLMYTKDEVFNRCYLLKQRTEEQIRECETVSPIIQSMDYFVNCFTFFHQNKSQENSLFEIKVNHFIDFNDILEFEINTNVNDLTMYLHSRKEQFTRGQVENSHSISRVKGYTIFFLYSKQVVESLTKPYETNCFDYNSIGFKSRDDCINKCRIKEMTSRFEGWPGEYRAHFLKGNQQRIYDNSEKYKQDQNLNFEIGIKCEAECDFRTECYKERFDLKKTAYPTRRNKFKLIFTFSDSPNSSIKHLPKISFEEFICFVGSLMGLYFGFSVITFTDLCSKLIKQLVLKPKVVSIKDWVNT